ncbi:MAG: glycosyltransferase [Pleurocapsa minor GSE-CHR-MK-17-07R]|nr:glycosyltransferase [Pleurocapsa minor GSE-CHR-MK 17-07R]
MSERILFVSSLHHPEALKAARARQPDAPPLFPPSMSQHFWEKALRRRGYVLDVFYRNLPGGLADDNARMERHAQGITPGKILSAINNRIPPELRPDVRRRNADLLAKARAFRPDILWMTGDNTIITRDTLEQIKLETGCLVVYACGTSPIVFSRPIDRACARAYDIVLASDYYHGVQWLELGAPRMEVLPIAACDPEFHKPYALTDDERHALACDVAFVGTLVPDNLYSRRVRALNALRDVDLGIWSVHDVPASLKPHVRGRALGEEMERILSAGKICFNTHGDFVLYGGNLRLFEVAGAGVFQVTDNLPGVREWFPETRDGALIATYRTLGELRDKVRWFLDHADEREAAARRAQAHVYAHHTYDNRVRKFEAIVADWRAGNRTLFGE